MATAEKLLTIEEYLKLAPSDRRTELVAGQIVEMNSPQFRHGRICVRVSSWLFNFVEEHRIGTVLGNDAGVITRRTPDSMRAPDAAFYSFDRVEQEPEGYSLNSPDAVFEVKSPSDRWIAITRKAMEYLEAGVLVVCVFDPETRTVSIYRPDQPVALLHDDQDLTLPEVSVDLKQSVAWFFRPLAR